MSAPVQIMGLSPKIITDAPSPKSFDGGHGEFGGRISERNSEQGSEAEIRGLPTKNLVITIDRSICNSEVNTQYTGSGFESKTVVECTQSPQSPVEEIDHNQVNILCDDRAIARRSQRASRRSTIMDKIPLDKRDSVKM
jgi:hypothetical protein